MENSIFLLSSYYHKKYYCRMYDNSHSRLDSLKIQPDSIKIPVKNTTARNFRMWDQNGLKFYTICPTPTKLKYYVPKCTKNNDKKQNFTSSSQNYNIF